jgi:hypothetical protein
MPAGLGDSVLSQLSAVRKVSLNVTLGGQDISSVLGPSLVSLSYHEAYKDEQLADSLEMTIADPEGKFRLTFTLATQQQITLSITVQNWAGPGSGSITKNCGIFYVTNVRIHTNKSQGTTISLSCSSINPSTSFRLERKSAAWSQTTVSGVAGQIATDNGWTLKFLPASDPASTRIDQHDHSDAYMLRKLCSENDFSFKIVSNTLWIRDNQEVEKQAPIGTIVAPTPDNVGGLNSSGIIDWSYSESTEDCAYADCVVSVKNNKSGKTVTQTTADPNATAPVPHLKYHYNEHGDLTSITLF